MKPSGLCGLLMTLILAVTVANAQDAQGLAGAGVDPGLNDQAQHLSKLTSFAVVLDEWNAGTTSWAAKCGVTRPGVEAGLRTTLSQSKIEIADSPALARDGIIELGVSISTQCVLTVTLQVKSGGIVLSSGRSTEVQIWEKAGWEFSTASPPEAGVRAIALVEQCAKTLVGDWNSAN